MNGEFVPWEDATIHVASHVVHYGSAIFEGIRAYNRKGKTSVFRLDEHIERLFYSCRIYQMPVPYTQDEVKQAIIETIRRNDLDACYIRPIVYRGYGSLGVDPSGCPVDVAIITWRWGKYLGEEAINQGVDVCVTSWARNAPNTTPSMAKCAANYMNAQLIKLEAIRRGKVEGIGLDAHGYLSEGSGENLFLVWKDVIYTPPYGAGILSGITRDSVMTIARQLGYPVVEQFLPREMLYVVDEVFFTGTAAEITPIRSVDGIPVGKGEPGPVTKAIQRYFFDLVEGEREDTYGWFTVVPR